MTAFGKAAPSLYVVTFQTGKRVLQLHCRHFGASSVHGLYEISDIVFSDSKILLHEEETLKSEFKDVERILLPWTAILRVDEMKSHYRGSDGPKLLDAEGVGQAPSVIEFPRRPD
jgi:hypothetical protein